MSRSAYGLRFVSAKTADEQRLYFIHAVTLLSILGLACVLRGFALNALGYNSDEAVYSGQAAAIAQDPILSEFFPIFRAHPLLFQFSLSLIYKFGVSDLAGRLLSAAVGVVTVYFCYRIGALLYGEKAGYLAALFLAIMPYHVIVTRQVLLDGPMTLFSTLTLYLVACYALTQRPLWLYASGVGMGLTFLAKETGILFVVSIFVFLALSPQIQIRIRDLALALAAMALTMAPFPLTLWLARGGGVSTSRQYLIWQFFRRPNHDWSFYFTTAAPAIGLALILFACLGLWVLRRKSSWRETLLLSWIVVPFLYFQLWPTKGYQYLLPLAPPIALLAARTMAGWLPGDDLQVRTRRLKGVSPSLLATGIVALSLLIPTWQSIYPSSSIEFLAGSGGVPGGRASGEWILSNTPEGTTLMTLGPSMSNLLQFYGHRRALGLSVSPNPLYRNPAYLPIANPDLQIRLGEIQYLVWDVYSAARSSFFADKLLEYAQKYNGRVVHVETVTVMSPNGIPISEPVIIIYQVQP